MVFPVGKVIHFCWNVLRNSGLELQQHLHTGQFTVQVPVLKSSFNNFSDKVDSIPIPEKN